MQPRSRRAVIVLDALGLAALAALFVLWCVRTPGLSVPGGIAAGCSAALFAAVGLRFVPAWVHFWQREGDAPAAVVSSVQGTERFAAPDIVLQDRSQSEHVAASVNVYLYDYIIFFGRVQRFRQKKEKPAKSMPSARAKGLAFRIKIRYNVVDFL